MQKAKMFEGASFDYVGAYENAIRELVQSCGSRSAANKLLDELHEHYERTDLALKKLRRETTDSKEHAAKKIVLLEKAKHDVSMIIEKHVPHTSDHVKELIMGASLAVTAALLPMTHGFSTVVAATSVIAIGGSYYIGFKLLRNWKAIAGKHTVSQMAGVVGPKHVDARRKLPSWVRTKK